MAKYLTDFLLLAGCGCILIGVYQVLPVATWFVGGSMLIGMGFIISIIKNKEKITLLNKENDRNDRTER